MGSRCCQLMVLWVDCTPREVRGRFRAVAVELQPHFLVGSSMIF